MILAYQKYNNYSSTSTYDGTWPDPVLYLSTVPYCSLTFCLGLSLHVYFILLLSLSLSLSNIALRGSSVAPDRSRYLEPPQRMYRNEGTRYKVISCMILSGIIVLVVEFQVVCGCGNSALILYIGPKWNWSDWSFWCSLWSFWKHLFLLHSVAYQYIKLSTR